MPNPKTYPEMDPTYGAKNDLPPSFSLICGIRHLRCLPLSGVLSNPNGSGEPFVGESPARPYVASRREPMYTPGLEG